MQSLSDIMASKNFDEPEEVAIIKEFVRGGFGSDAAVTVQDKVILINVKSASLAGALRPHMHELKLLLDTNKRLIIRIG